MAGASSVHLGVVRRLHGRADGLTASGTSRAGSRARPGRKKVWEKSARKERRPPIKSEARDKQEGRPDAHSGVDRPKEGI